jgi:hypothetical protein
MLRIPVYYFARQLERDKSNHNVVYSSKYDGVWTPKYRRSVLGGVVAERCEGVIRQVASNTTPTSWLWSLCQILCTFGAKCAPNVDTSNDLALSDRQWRCPGSETEQVRNLMPPSTSENNA